MASTLFDPLPRWKRRAFIKAVDEVRAMVRKNGVRTMAEIAQDLARARDEIARRFAHTAFSEANRRTLINGLDFTLNGLGKAAETRTEAGAKAIAALAHRTILQEVDIPPEVRPLALGALPDLNALGVAQGEQVADLIKGATEDLKAKTRNLLRRTLAGEQTLPDFMAKLAPDLPSPGPFGTYETRAEVIVRTEYGRTMEVARDVQRDALHKTPGVEVLVEWVTARDERVRDSHRILDGVTVRYGEDFSVGGWPAAFPLDPRLPAAESINCRCLAVTRVERKK